jgi:predicted NUDIX family phosphoesterase
MGAFLKAAYQVLKSSGRPLTANEITEAAIARDLLESKGNTPWLTMKSKLSTDILGHGEQSLFMRSDVGQFALREWKNQIAEHVADRYQKALFDEDIVVFPADSLTKYIRRVGLHRDTSCVLGLMKECYAMRRRLAEEDFTVVQLVSVFIIRFKDQVLTHKRTKRLPESRLHGFYSANFGGHLNPKDVGPLFNIFAPDQAYPMLERELHEEVRFPPGAAQELIYRGLLYDDSRPVSRQHIGFVYEVVVDTNKFEIGERGFLMYAKYEGLDQIRQRISEFENWSVILVQALEEVCR